MSRSNGGPSNPQEPETRRVGAGIESLFRPNAKAVLLEAPGSQSFEMSDIPAIAKVAHAKGTLVSDDNTARCRRGIRPLPCPVEPCRHSPWRAARPVFCVVFSKR